MTSPVPKPQNKGTGAVTKITSATHHPQLLTMKECSSKEVLIVKKSWNDPLWLSSQPNWPDGQQDQGHGVVLHDWGEGYQHPITFRSGSRQLSISVEEVSLYFLGGDPIPYIGLVPIDPRSSYMFVTNTMNSISHCFPTFSQINYMFINNTMKANLTVSILQKYQIVCEQHNTSILP